MTVKHLTSDQIIVLVRAGGGVRLNAPSFTADQLTRIARAASEKRAMVILENSSSLTSDSMVVIGRAGGGAVIFE